MAESPVAARGGEEHTESREPVMGLECVSVLDIYLVTAELTGVAFTELDGAEIRPTY